MQAVILAAGRGSRMGDLTNGTPKPLLELKGKPLVQHSMEALPDTIDEIVMVVGYLRDAIQQHIGDSFRDRKITYIVQEDLNGTAGALWVAKDALRDRFVVLMADDMYGKGDMEKCISTPDWVELVQKRDAVKSKGKVEVDDSNLIVRIVEGDHGNVPGLLSTNFFVLDTRLFAYPMVPKSEGSKEFGLPQTIIAASADSGIPFRAVEGVAWREVTTPQDIQEVEKTLAQD